MKHRVPLHVFMGWPGPTTHRQFAAWCAWEAMQWNRPSRADWYVMLVAYHVAVSQAKNPKGVRFESFRLKFKEDGGPKMDPRKAAMMAKATVLARIHATRVRLPDGTLVDARDVIRGEFEAAQRAAEDEATVLPAEELRLQGDDHGGE